MNPISRTCGYRKYRPNPVTGRRVIVSFDGWLGCWAPSQFQISRNDHLVVTEQTAYWFRSCHRILRWSTQRLSKYRGSASVDGPNLCKKFPYQKHFIYLGVPHEGIKRCARLAVPSWKIVHTLKCDSAPAKSTTPRKPACSQTKKQYRRCWDLWMQQE